MFDIRTTDLTRLNSLTKYPSIPTYHALDPRNGGLLPETVPFDGPVVLTEKVDGTNTRLISLPDGSYLLGSREELLYARGDLIGNPALGIVEALKPFAERLRHPHTADAVTVLFVELYGGKITAASKHYTTDQSVAYRLFDVAVIADYAQLLVRDTREISSWRDSGGQVFLEETALVATADALGLQLTPRIGTLDGSAMPKDIEAAHAFLGEHIARSLSTLDAAASGKPEGLVVRTPDRRAIAKMRFEDYEHTLRRRKG
ncbi:RNA ligase family protein [Tahibacter amnicola]|uniref:RNA ligase family protein n=1 Tax=Tahibacter amnicola TaxID=2976241 RepID=A0ABY6BDT6_9GAMM|nr:RNA ligase family protein [Tahibacter amnicola]UXI68196.1 RNA ligase family protein [Tahibacter amnicola]